MEDIEISIEDIKTLTTNFKRDSNSIISSYTSEISAIEREMNSIRLKYAKYSYVVSKTNDIKNLLNELDSINKNIKTN